MSKFLVASCEVCGNNFASLAMGVDSECEEEFKLDYPNVRKIETIPDLKSCECKVKGTELLKRCLKFIKVHNLRGPQDIDNLKIQVGADFIQEICKITGFIKE